MSEQIEIQNNIDTENWIPFVGEETNELLRSKGFANPDRTLNESGQRVLDETYRIMQVCGSTRKTSNCETGIVIGYVQSGKTLSFTTLTALARDNNYQIVIIIGGTSVNLLDQSTKRVRKDLRIDSRYGYEQRWTQITNPSTQEDFDTITNALDQWANPTFPDERCRTILVTVMKNGSHLRNLADLFTGMNLIGVPTLIIDDEGDQASLNTRARWASRQGIDIEDLSENEVSTIYRRITTLRNTFPHHTFLQYTATPQANLFINILDRLSPNFIKLLTPGDEYTGGIQFFRENPSLIREIPLNNIANTNQPLNEPPEILLDALRVFYLGVAAGIVLELYRLPSQRNRSMLVHPSRLQGDHTTFYAWVNTIKESWRRILSGKDDEDKSELLLLFRNAYNDLQSTVADLPTFENLTDFNLIHAIQYTPIIEVNSRRGATPQINWQDSYSWILVGGQSMDRGFTIEGLTVTYMPRNVGVGNVDTIQQRARFYGYKRSYLGYCRVYLDQVTIDAYSFIIEHEEDVRSRLEEFASSNRHLNEWDREAVLDQMLNLTRANILYDDLDRDRFGNDWFRIKAPHDTPEFIELNRTTILNYIIPKTSEFAEDQGSVLRTDEQRNLVARLPLIDCLNNLLNKLKFTRETDSATYSSLRGILKRHLEDHPDDECLLFLMNTKNIENWNSGIRKLDRNDEINPLFQGSNLNTGFLGAREIKDANMVSIQLYILDIRSTQFTGVPLTAIWIPESIGKDIIRQL